MAVTFMRMKHGISYACRPKAIGTYRCNWVKKHCICWLFTPHHQYSMVRKIVTACATLMKSAFGLIICSRNPLSYGWMTRDAAVACPLRHNLLSWVTLM